MRCENCSGALCLKIERDYGLCAPCHLEMMLDSQPTQRNQLLTEIRERVEAMDPGTCDDDHQLGQADALQSVIAIIDEFMTPTEPDESEG